MKNNENGRSMIEMLGVLAIAGIMTVGGYGLITSMQDSYETNKIIDEVSSLARRVRSVARDCEQTVGTKMNQYVYDGKAYPDELTYDNTNFVGTADVTYDIYYYKTDQTLYIIGINGLSVDACIQLVTTNWGGVSTSGFRGVAVGGAYDTVAKAAATTSVVQPMSLSNATTKCNGTSAVYMTFN